jgi:pimeloyl-ACP methyl ester carboxylesterase
MQRNDDDPILKIDLGGATLEVARSPATQGQAPTDVTVAAAHPADAMGTATAALLAGAADLPVVCINPRGLGASTAAPAGGQRLEQMVDDLEAVRRQLGLGAWVFWGMSGGGWLGQIYARKYPQAIRGLILESVCACFRVRLADPDCLLSPLHPAWRAALEGHGLIAPDAHAGPGAAVSPREEPPTTWIDVEGVGSVWRDVDGPARLVAPFPLSPEMRACMPQLWAFDARGWLGEIATPTLVIAGDADPVVPVAHAQALYRGIRGAEMLTVAGAGHVPVGQGRPEVGEAVRRFVRERVA